MDHIKLNRRNLTLAATSLLGISTVPPAYASQTPQASPEAGGWSFPDARGFTFTLPSQPVRVVCESHLAQALYDYGYEVVGHFWASPEDPDYAPADSLDLSTLPNIGVWGEFDFEALLTLEPDLIIDYYMSSPDFEWEGLWSIYEDEHLEMLESIAPLLTLPSQGTSARDCIQAVYDLAAALGADMTDPAILADIDAFEAAEADLGTALQSTSGVNVTVIYFDDLSTMRLAVPAWHNDLIYFSELGMQFMPFEADSLPAWGYFSTETLGTLDTDVILHDGTDPAELPIWATLAAVESGQTGIRKEQARLSHRSFSSTLANLAILMSESENVTS